METGIGPCFEVISGSAVALPKLKLHFKGGAEMALPLENYFTFIGKTGAVCLAMVTKDGFGAGSSDYYGNFSDAEIFLLV